MAINQARDAAQTLPLSPEQQALAGRAPDGAGLDGHWLLQAEAPLDLPRLAAALQAAVQGHELLWWQVARVPGFRQSRLVRGAEPPVVALAPQPGTPGVHAPGAVLRLAAVPDHPGQALLTAPQLLLDDGSLRRIVARALGGDRPQATQDADGFDYLQYIAWRRGLDAQADAGRGYWDAFLDGEAWHAPVLACRQDGVAGAGAERHCCAGVATPAQQRALEQVAQASALDLRTVVQALWWLLLARLGGGARFVGGWVHDCRDDYEVMADAVGVFEKCLPVFIEPRDGETLGRWLARFGDMVGTHTDQQEYWPLVEAPLSAHHAVGFVARSGPVCGPGRAWQLQARPDPAQDFELSLELAAAQQSVAWTLSGDPQRYPAEAVQRLGLQFSALLDAVARDAALEQAVDAIDLVGEQERALLLAASRGHGPAAPAQLLGRIAEWAERTPQATALEAGTQRLSYRELMDEVRRQALWLRSLGVERGGLVALVLPRSMQLVSAMLAVWQAGAAFLPIEPDWPAARRQAMLEDARPVLVVHGADWQAAAQEGPWREVALDPAAWPGAAALPPAGPWPAPTDVAYVLYTSGSTGRPKGVVIEHAQLAHYVAAVSDALALHLPRRWALVSTMAADLGHTAMFGALFHGACLVVADPVQAGDAQAFSRFVVEQGIDAVKIVPSHLDALLECEQPQLPATLVLGGEAAPRALLERIRAIAPGCTVHNHYGPTETTVGVMVHTLAPDQAPGAVLPLTQVLGQCRVHVLDEARRLVPAGAQGEVYVGGAQLCRGYLNRDGGDDFIDDPFEPGQRLYRTRDLARVLPQGGIVLSGRRDEQLKVRGFRVQPAEIEAALLAQPGVRQAVVVQTGADPAGAQLVACVVGVAEPGLAAVRDGLAAVLPAHMLPTRLIALDAFARLANGKIDRQAVRQLAEARNSAGGTPAGDALEQEVSDLMAGLLGLQALGRDQDFFELGAHSLMVIKLVARLRKRFGIETAPAAIFDNATPAALARVLRSQLPAQAGLALQP